MNVDYNSLLPVREFPDHGIKWLLESPENMHTLMNVFAPDLAESIDFGRQENVPQSFIPDNLREQESDLVFLAPYRDVENGTEREVTIYLLLEHQSTSDPTMTFRVLFYMLQIWDTQRREWLDQKIPKGQWSFRPILPVVFYTGDGNWKRLRSMTELMELPKALVRFVPNPDILFMNLKGGKRREELIATGHPFGWILNVIQKENATKETLTEAIKLAVIHLEELPEEEQNQWAKLIYYLILLIYYRREPDEHEELISLVTESVHETTRQREVVKMGKTTAQVLIEEGEKRGEKRGEIRGMLRAKQEDLLRLIQVRFGSVSQDVEDKIKATSDVSHLTVLFEQGLIANNIDEMEIE
ncbi:Rpn family recombination-promoting nuclease/putative transposase [bacterium]|nr:Rpn family recombination-promoting nuclease/putative transposase [bacterium]